MPTVLDWDARQIEIQSRFFRPPPYAYLWMEYAPKAHYLAWCFNFMDLGMCHSLSSKAIVRIQPDGTYVVDDTPYPDEDAALEAVFGGHYAHFMSELYRDLRVDQI